MASLVLGGAGAIAGFMLGGPPGAALGFMIGSAVGNMLFPTNTEGPRLQDRTVQISSYGAAIPIPYGSERLAGNVIWPANFQVDEYSTTTTSGGKGGPTQTGYGYRATFAILVGKAPPGGFAGYGKVWFNKKWVVTLQGSAFPWQSSGDVMTACRWYLGTDTQDPDPLMVARDGSAPGYRGFGYIVFEGIELTNSGMGNRPPNVEVEVFTKAVASGPPDPRVVYDGASATVPDNTSAIALIDPNTGYIWSVSPTFLGSSVDINVTDDSSGTLLTSLSTALGSNIVLDIRYVPVESGSLGNEIWIIAGIFGGHHELVIYSADNLSYIESVDLGAFGTSLPNQSIYDPSTRRVLSFLHGGAVHVINPVNRTIESTFSLPGSLGTVSVGSVIFTADYLAVFVYGSTNALQLLNPSDYSLHQQITVGLSGSSVAYDSARNRLVVSYFDSMDYDVVDVATGSVTTYTLTTAVGGDTDPYPSNAIQSVLYYGDKYIFGANSGTSGPHPDIGTTLYVVDPTTLTTVNTWTYESYDAPAQPLMIPGLLAPNGSPNYILSFDETHIKRLYLGGGVSGAPVTLASIISSIDTMQPFGLDAEDIDVTQLTDLVDGFLIGQQMTRRAAQEALQPPFFWDAVDSDHKIKYVKRGQAPCITIRQEDRAAHQGGSDLPVNLAITRGSELELPWAINVNYTDQATDYQVGTQYDRRITRNANSPITLNLPVVMTSEKAKQVATVNLYLAWANRTKFSFSTSLKYAKYEPTDVVLLPTDEATYTALITSRNDQGNGIIQWETALEDVTVYTQTGTVAASNFVPQVIPGSGSGTGTGTTILELLDIPILRDVDNDPGYYVAMGGTTSAWRGATLYKSADSGSTYDPMLAITNASAIAVAQSILGDFTAGNIFDEGNSVTVHLRSGGALISATETQVLNGSNMAVLGAPGRWEVFNYKNATLIATDTYQLSGLLRGRRGTEWATSTHAVGDTFVLATVDTWQRPAVGSGELGLTRLYKAPAFGTFLSAAASQSFTDTAVGLKPYSSVDLTATRDGSNNATLTWRPRSRIGYGTLNATVPVGEAVESYSIDVYTDGTYTIIADTISAIDTSLTINADGTRSTPYTAAQQTAAGLTPGDPLYTLEYKLSAVVGRGYPLEATV